jgi:hypothetical protein
MVFNSSRVSLDICIVVVSDMIVTIVIMVFITLKVQKTERVTSVESTAKCRIKSIAFI